MKIRVLRIVAFHSYKGGSGKSLFSSNIASMLQSRGKKVLLIEADFPMPCLNEVFPDQEPDLYFNDYLDQTKQDMTDYIFTNSTDLDVMYCDPDFNSKHPVFSSDISWFNKKREQIRKDLDTTTYDLVVFDLSPGVHLFTINALALATDIFLMLRPDYHSINGTMGLLDKIYSRAVNTMKSRLELIINQVPDYNKMVDNLNDWKIGFEMKYDFIHSVQQISYQPVTAYHSFIQQFILPENDPTYEIINTLANGLMQ